MDVAITFNISGNDENGQIFLYAAAGSTNPVGTLDVRFSLSGPGGIAYKPYPTDPDFSLGNGESNQIQIPVPLDSEGNYVSGTYTARCRIADNGTPDPVAPFDGTYEFDFVPSTTPTSFISPLVSVEATASCDTGIYGVGTYSETIDDLWGIDEEFIDVIPEAAAANDEPADSNDPEIYYPFGYTNADYLVRYTIVATIEDTELSDTDSFIWYHVEKMVAEVTVTTQCVPPDMCKVASCLEKEFRKLNPMICAKGWRGITKREKAKLMKAVYLANIIQMYHTCGNTDKVREHIEDFELHLDCSCECGENTSGPQPYVVPNQID